MVVHGVAFRVFGFINNGLVLAGPLLFQYFIAITIFQETADQDLNKCHESFDAAEIHAYLTSKLT